MTIFHPSLLYIVHVPVIKCNSFTLNIFSFISLYWTELVVGLWGNISKETKTLFCIYLGSLYTPTYKTHTLYNIVANDIQIYNMPTQSASNLTKINQHISLKRRYLPKINVSVYMSLLMYAYLFCLNFFYIKNYYFQIKMNYSIEKSVTCIHNSEFLQSTVEIKKRCWK